VIQQRGGTGPGHTPCTSRSPVIQQPGSVRFERAASHQNRNVPGATHSPQIHCCGDFPTGCRSRLEGRCIFQACRWRGFAFHALSRVPRCRRNCADPLFGAAGGSLPRTLRRAVAFWRIGNSWRHRGRRRDTR
jgi:hypothetical protein